MQVILNKDESKIYKDIKANFDKAVRKEISDRKMIMHIIYAFVFYFFTLFVLLPLGVILIIKLL